AIERGAYRFLFPGAKNLKLFEDLLDRSFSNFAEGNIEAVAVLSPRRKRGCPGPPRVICTLVHSSANPILEK
ncbi:MAG: hypothetical protein MI747_09560, partial [Desulfobacterales bacterium]|nr:hypothetical protein [Desulfobacterales bacterium]